MGMAITHALAAGMGGVRTAGDLVARMQMSRGMRLKEAKEYVASRLGVSVTDLTDETVMNEVRESLDIGRIRAYPGYARGIDAKFRIAKLLDIEINSVKRFQERVSRW
jgi:dimethylamine--corrinoid protein Co-methyltransferase